MEASVSAARATFSVTLRSASQNSFGTSSLDLDLDLHLSSFISNVPMVNSGTFDTISHSSTTTSRRNVPCLIRAPNRAWNYVHVTVDIWRMKWATLRSNQVTQGT